MEQLEGKVAVVTGAASGMGRAFAERFVQEGMKVVLADVEAGALETAVSELREAGGDVVGVQTDVSRLEEVDSTAIRSPRAKRASEQPVSPQGDTDLHRLYELGQDRDRHTEIGGPPTGEVPKEPGSRPSITQDVASRSRRSDRARSRWSDRRLRAACRRRCRAAAERTPES